ncbi:hypothetical protein LCGC14_0428160 [marine sediment metagenome]|uniref:Uncharacterized protein n=1 Tax=marine sediment metagenome TaxID=412755 RepID=A0A0F9VAS4_9ZZZZ
MTKILFIWLMVLYTGVIVYSVMFALTIKEGEQDKLTMIHRIMYRHGTIVVGAIIAAAVLSLAGIGVWSVFDIP